VKTIVILGMHRSATSLVARTLNSEVHMGKHLLKGLPDNPKGHYENVEVIKINDKILHKSGGSWLNPPPEEKILEVGQTFESEIQDLVWRETELAKSKNMESWGFKDPRTCLTIGVWSKYIPNPQFIVCYRNSMDIAISLQKRNGFTLERGIELTNEYNNRIFKFLKDFYE